MCVVPLGTESELLGLDAALAALLTPRPADEPRDGKS
jgi:hypothetical protein